MRLCLACCRFPIASASARDADRQALERRLAAAQRAHAILGLRQVIYLGLPDNRMDSAPLLDVVQRLESSVREIAPQVVYTHHHGDLNIDHRITHQAVMTAFRPLPGSSVREIYGFEVLSSTEWAAPRQAAFAPDVFVDITNHLDVKLKALQAYELEMRAPPHSRSLAHVEHLARHRGYSVGLEAAEAFAALRIIR